MLLSLLCCLSGCGESVDGGDLPPPPGHFARCVLEGLPPPVAVTVAGADLLFVCGDDHRTVYGVSRADVRAGRTVTARALSLDVRESAPVSGGDALAVQGYQLRHLWELPLDLQGIAVQEPEFVFLGERRLRVVYWGRLVRDAAGRVQRLSIDYAFSAPGAERTLARGGDWEDKGPGLGALLAVNRSGMTEDLYLADRGRAGPGRFTVWRLDRYGTPLGSFDVTAGEAAPRLVALTAERERFLALIGESGAALAPFTDPGRGRQAPLGGAVPTPPLPGGQWRAAASASDGTLYLVGRDEHALVLAWRRP